MYDVFSSCSYTVRRALIVSLIPLLPKLQSVKHHRPFNIFSNPGPFLFLKTSDGIERWNIVTHDYIQQ